ncbi:MAG: helix-turn-helix domain-containing protein, partial [Clostridia bacterium]|nr:helix-turn-helix domain-containing protein [Clostridia bacterium]
MKTKIAENIKFFRKQMGLTQEELAQKLCGKKSLVSNYENGYSTPDVYT